MADVELVIKLPEDNYKSIVEKYDTFPEQMKAWGLCAIKNGTPLPKGHGRIVDESKITKCEQVGVIMKDYNMTRVLKTDAPTIIEAEKED